MALAGQGCSVFNDLDSLRPTVEGLEGCFEELDPGGPNPPRDWLVLTAESRATLSGCHRDERTNIDNSLAYTVAFEVESFDEETRQAKMTYTRNAAGGEVVLEGSATWDIRGNTDPADDTLTLVRPDEDPDRTAATVFMERCNPDHACSELGLPALLTSPSAIMAATSSGSSVLRLFPAPAPAASPPPPPRDPRFFGNYCELGPRKFCKDVRLDFGFFSFGIRRECVTVTDVHVRMRHLDSPGGGLLHGGGTFTADGKRGMLAAAGLVTRRGRARVSARIPGLGHEMGTMWLTNDGHGATLAAHGEEITLSKETCGNRTPVVSIVTTTGFTDHVRGRACFTGRVIDDEDAAFPLSRLSFSSSRDGVLSGATIIDARSARVCARSLSNGRHQVTFSATDSGGLQGNASVELVAGVVVAPVD
jgi:hypothetical protein